MTDLTVLYRSCVTASDMVGMQRTKLPIETMHACDAFRNVDTAK